jgi:hypothetical protein
MVGCVDRMEVIIYIYIYIYIYIFFFLKGIILLFLLFELWFGEK